MTRYTNEELLELAGAYALGATSVEEAKAFEDALVSSPTLAAEVMAYHKVVTDLAMAQPGVPPSPEVRERLFERIQVIESDARSTVSNLSTARPAPRAVAGAVERFFRLVPMAAAASLVLAAALGLQIARLRGEVGSLRTHEQQVAAKLEHRERTLNTLLHAEKDLRVVHLKAADTVKGPGIQLFWDEHHGSGIVHAFRLPPAPEGQAYQLWAIINGKPTSVRVFNSDPDGHALVEGVILPSTTKGVSAMLVTVEPRGGSPTPTSVPVMGGNVVTE